MKGKILVAVILLLAFAFLFHAPAEGKVTSGYGIRFLAGSWFHAGSDLGLREGTAVRPVSWGTVAEVSASERWGNWLRIEHFPGLTSRYLHLHSVAVKEGDRVSHGTVIGLSGNTGSASTGPHLHFEIHLFKIPLPAYLICLPGKLLRKHLLPSIRK